MFDEFWQAYPRKVGKLDARKAWRQAVKAADPAVIVEAARVFGKSKAGQNGQYTPYPATWLRSGRWADDPAEWGVKPETSRNEEMLAAGVYSTEDWLEWKRRGKP